MVDYSYHTETRKRRGEGLQSQSPKQGGRAMTKWQDVNGIPVDDAGRYDAALIDWEVLDALPTLHQGYTADLKLESNHQRVWLERTTTADGEHCDHHITVESYDRGDRWVITSEN